MRRNAKPDMTMPKGKDVGPATGSSAIEPLLLPEQAAQILNLSEVLASQRESRWIRARIHQDRSRCPLFRVGPAKIHQRADSIKHPRRVKQEVGIILRYTSLYIRMKADH